MSTEIGGECTIEKKIDWLHGTSDIMPDTKNENVPISSEPQGRVIDEYFGAEEKKEVKEMPAKEVEGASVPNLDSNSESPTQGDKKEAKADASEEWLIVD
eukprot:TRINITY_DN12201_c0_g1_i1.p3 TRINITY_DN12201_c0_g1~~TRINITY_DN12201_c0_g1_i1.p3  ORF type:complete len:100 (-),score=21.73 TRINITY_DN12201_c0_g1_i1:149-448(-)